MKKTYIQPASKVYDVKPSQMIATSMTLNSDTQMGGSSALSDRFRRGSSWDEE